MNVLFVTGHLPSAMGREAGARCSYEICKFFSEQGEVHLLAFARDLEWESFDVSEMAIFESWNIVPLGNHARLRNIIAHPLLPVMIAGRQSRKFGRILADLCRKYSPDIVVLDHSAMLAYRRWIPDTAVVVASLHDILAQSWDRKIELAGSALKRFILSAESRRVRRWEDRIFRKLDILLVLSEKDARLLRDEFPPALPVMVIDPAMHSAKLPEGQNARRPDSTLLFWGAMNRPENNDAATWAAEDIFPKIRSAVPHAEFHIAGNRSSELASTVGHIQGVRTLGFIEDISDLMAKTTIALLPLRIGAGIKVKTLECMAAGVPVVTTEIGAEGIEGTNDVHFIVRSSADEIAEAAIRLLQNPMEAQRIGDAGQQLIHQVYDFNGKMTSARNWMSELVIKKKQQQKSM